MLLSIRTLFSLVGITLQPLATLRRRSLMPALTFCSMALGLLSTQSSLNAQSVTFSGTLPVTLSSSFNYPYGVAVDAAGDVFVAEINTASVKEIVAVNGSIPANPTIRTLSSAFNDPIGVAVDTIGNVYVADGNNFVYEIVAVDGAIPSNPTIRTLGSGFNGPGGVAVDGSGNVYVGDSINDAVKEIVAVNGVIPANPTILTLGSGFSEPLGVAVDGSGNVYVADSANNAVKEIVAVDGSIPANPTILTLGSGFSDPTGVAVDGAGNVYVADSSNDAVKKIVAVNGVIPADPTILSLSSPFNGPGDVAVDGKGNVYVSDTIKNAVLEFQGQTVNFGSANICPNGQTTPAPCSSTLTLTYSITAGTNIGNIKVLTGGAPNLDFHPQANDTSATLCSAKTYSSATTCTVDVSFAPLAPGQRIGVVQISDQNNNVLATTSIYGTGVGPAAAFNTPSSLVTLGSLNAFGTAVDAAGNLFFASLNNGAVYRVQAGSGVANYPNPPQSIGSGFSAPVGVALDGAGNVFVTDLSTNAVMEITASSSYTTVVTVATGFNSPAGLAVDNSGNIFVADSGNNAVKEIQAVNGSIPASPNVVTLAPTFTGFNTPFSIAVDGSGDVFVGDSGDNNLYEIQAAYGSIPPNPNIITLSNSTGGPNGLAVDAAGDLYVAFTFGPFIQEFLAVNGTIPASPTILTLYSQSNGRDFQPITLALDSTGDIFVTDGGNTVFDEIVRSVAPAIGFAPTVVGSTSSDSPQSLQLQNIGNATLIGAGPILSDSEDFSLVAGSGTPADCTGGFSLAPGAQCNLSFDFNPQSPTSLSATATLTDNTLNANAGPKSTQTIALSGIGLSNTPPKLQVSPTTVNFGSVPYPDGAVTQNVTLSNIGGRILNDIKATSNGPSVSIIKSTCANGVLSGSSCTLTLLFAPYSNGTRTNTITVTTTNGGTGIVRTTGYAGAVVPSTTSLNFGSVPRGGTATLPLTFTNKGISGAVTVAYASGSTSFKVTSNGCATGITTGNTCTAEIEFAPASSGTKTATIKFTPSSGPTYNITLTGTLNP